MDTSETAMRRRAVEIIQENLKDTVDIEQLLKSKIERCDKIMALLQKESTCSPACGLCPFPRKDCTWTSITKSYSYCCSCEYFFKGTTGPLCGCNMLSRGILTPSQAIKGLELFKTVMEEYLEKRESSLSTLYEVKPIDRYFYYAYDSYAKSYGYGFWSEGRTDHSEPFPTISHAKAAFQEYVLHHLEGAKDESTH